MSIKKRFISRIDELNYIIETAYGYRFGDFDKPLKTPDTFEDFDELITSPTFAGFDELKITDTNVKKSVSSAPIILTDTEKKKLKDDILEYLIFAYTDGIDAVNEMMVSDVKATEDGMFLAIEHKTAGKDYAQRLDEHMANSDVAGIKRVAETEFHRIFNTAIVDGGKIAGAKSKTWKTMLDDRVRDTHELLEDVTIPFGDKFYTQDGDSAFTPGGFSQASNNANCRCFIQIA